MSLRTFHLMFMTAAFLACAGFAYWCFAIAAEQNSATMVMGVCSALVSIGIIFYARWYISKLKLAAVAVLGFLSAAHPANACTICFGASSDKMAIGHNFGVMTLLAVIIAVLVCFACFFVGLMLKARRAEALPKTTKE